MIRIRLPIVIVIWLARQLFYRKQTNLCGAVNGEFVPPADCAAQQRAATGYANVVVLIALDHVRGNDARTERENVRIVQIDRHMQPVMIGRSEGFDAQEVF